MQGTYLRLIIAKILKKLQQLITLTSHARRHTYLRATIIIVFQAPKHADDLQRNRANGQSEPSCQTGHQP